MKKFIYNILLFVLPVMSILTVVDYVFSKQAVKSNYDGIEAWYDLMHGNIDADVVVMGNSRAWVHVSPLILDSILNTSTYNLGINGSAINRQIHKYNLFRKYNRKPKIIIQNIDYSSLGYTIGYAKNQIFPYFWNKAIRDEFFYYEPFTVCEKYVPMYRYYWNYDRAKLHGLLVSTERKLTKGYKGQEEVWDGSKLKAVNSIAFTTNDTTMTMFDNYLAQAKAEGIKVVFVYAPLYIEAIEKIENMDEMHATYQAIADKYNIPILDYMNMEISSDTTYFYNATHLNRRGAEIYSDSLANGIKRLGVLK